MSVWGRAPSPVRSPRSCGDYDHQGGKSSENFGLIRLVRAGFWSVSYKIHWRLCLFKFRPRHLLTGPLSTTFVHILRLKALLSIRKFKAITRPTGSIQKAQQIADYYF